MSYVSEYVERLLKNCYSVRQIELSVPVTVYTKPGYSKEDVEAELLEKLSIFFEANAGHLVSGIPVAIVGAPVKIAYRESGMTVLAGARAGRLRPCGRNSCLPGIDCPYCASRSQSQHTPPPELAHDEVAEPERVPA